MSQAAEWRSIPLRSEDDIFIYSVLPLDSFTFIALCSDDKVTAFSAKPNPAKSLILWTLDTPHGGVKQALIKHINNESVLITAGNDGRICLWDLRSKAGPQQTIQHSTVPILSLASHPSSSILAAGTEFANHEATIQLWDLRQPGNVLLRYTESHSDDVVELRYHPTNPAVLLSGSTDGLVNIYNTNVADEDDAVIRVFNHGSSISHAGFLQDDLVYALSSDEQCTLYNLHPEQEYGGGENDIARSFGDVRQVLGCDYVVDILTMGREPRIAAGQSRLDLIPLRKMPTWEFIPQDTMQLERGLGTEIVRTVWIDQADEHVITGSEDSTIRIWGHFL